ncbi:hypothetical protein BDV19DRAFT_206166 [Aspergillus venezuelensis]
MIRTTDHRDCGVVATQGPGCRTAVRPLLIGFGSKYLPDFRCVVLLTPDVVSGRPRDNPTVESFSSGIRVLSRATRSIEIHSAHHIPLTVIQPNMAVSALDSRIFRNLFGTQEVRDIFTDDAYVGFLVDVEAALARAEAAVGVIPASTGEAITDALAKIDLEYDSPAS